tara:strand:+ start:6979 stop:7947 length:969 start_codon:yes stop_codon:yes gene_type:complete
LEVGIAGYSLAMPMKAPHHKDYLMEHLNELTDNIIAALEEGVESGNWTKPWQIIGGDCPVNAQTGNNYKGMNILVLLFKAQAKGYSTPYWAGIRQWNRLGAKVKPEEKHTKIVFLDRKTDVSLDSDGEKVAHSWWVRKTLRVWNADQIEGWSPPTPEEMVLSDDVYIDTCDKFVEATKIRIFWGGMSACFFPTKNEIHMPPREHFLTTTDGTAAYHVYSVLFHELGHATGHEDRLDRKFGKFGDNAYAIEELVAELTSAFLCGQLGIADKTTPRADHLKYLKSWLKLVKEDRTIIMKCAGEAQKAVDYLNEEVKKTTRQQAA